MFELLLVLVLWFCPLVVVGVVGSDYGAERHRRGGGGEVPARAEERQHDARLLGEHREEREEQGDP